MLLSTTKAFEWAIRSRTLNFVNDSNQSKNDIVISVNLSSKCMILAKRYVGMFFLSSSFMDERPVQVRFDVLREHSRVCLYDTRWE